MSDVPTPLDFVDPLERDDTYRVVLWASPGQGKSVAAASAPSPILVLTADRPSAYRFARKHHGHTAQTLRETRFVDAGSLDAVFRYLSSDEGKDVRTVVVDPVSNVYDHLVDTLPLRGDGEPNYQTVNKKVLGFVQSLRRFDINVVLVAHEKLNDGRKGDGKLYPALGGPSLINKLLAEMDLVAHIERVVRTTDDGEQQLWVGQLQPRDNLVCKESTGALGDRRVADLSRWFQVASEALAPDDSDLPFVETEADLEHAEPEELKAA
jgi:hypothetical protein